MQRKIATGISIVGIVLLILDPATAMTSAKESIALCLQSLIPTLFPFLLLSGILTAGIQGNHAPWLSALGRKSGIGQQGVSTFLLGILGGYPVGAQSISQQYRNKSITKDTAQILLSFCNNAGPSFLFGILGPQFSAWWMPWAIWGILILSAYLTGIILKYEDIPDSSHLNPSQNFSMPEMVSKSVKTMGTICGWVMIFRIGIGYLLRFIPVELPQEVQVLLTGTLELANGCCQIHQIHDESLRFLVASIMLSFGGVCVLMQTASVCGELGIRSYLRGKFLQTLIAAFLALTILLPHLILVVLPAAIYFFLQKRKKVLANPIQMMYNTENPWKRGN